MYEPKCEAELEDSLYLSTGQILSYSRDVIYFLKHDYHTNRAISWFKWDEHYDLTTLFPIYQCPSIYYLPSGKCVDIKITFIY